MLILLLIFWLFGFLLFCLIFLWVFRVFFLILDFIFLFYFLLDLLVILFHLWNPIFFDNFPWRWYLWLLFWQFLFLFKFLWTLFRLKHFSFALLNILLCTLLVYVLWSFSFGKRLLKSLLYETRLLLFFREKRIFLDLWMYFGLLNDFWINTVWLFMVWGGNISFSALVELFICFKVFFFHLWLSITVFAQSKTLLA